MDREAILKELLTIVGDMTADWENGFQGHIGPETLLVGDLAFESIDVVQLAVAIEEHFGRQGLPFEKLMMTEGRYVEDLCIDQIVAFLAGHLGR